MGRLQVNILGTSFSVQAREDEEYLKKLLSYYKEITDTISSSGNLRDPMQISILAGITLVDELYKAKGQNAESNEAERLTMEMIEQITKALQ